MAATAQPPQVFIELCRASYKDDCKSESECLCGLADHGVRFCKRAKLRWPNACKADQPGAGIAVERM